MIFSRYSWIYPLHNKSEVFAIFLKFKVMLKTYSHVLLNNFRVIMGENFYLINLETFSVNMESITG
jgi:hypothetical protein